MLCQVVFFKNEKNICIKIANCGKNNDISIKYCNFCQKMISYKQ